MGLERPKVSPSTNSGNIPTRRVQETIVGGPRGCQARDATPRGARTQRQSRERRWSWIAAALAFPRAESNENGWEWVESSKQEWRCGRHVHVLNCNACTPFSTCRVYSILSSAIEMLCLTSIDNRWPEYVVHTSTILFFAFLVVDHPFGRLSTHALGSACVERVLDRTM